MDSQRSPAAGGGSVACSARSATARGALWRNTARPRDVFGHVRVPRPRLCKARQADAGKAVARASAARQSAHPAAQAKPAHRRRLSPSPPDTSAVSTRTRRPSATAACSRPCPAQRTPTVVSKCPSCRSSSRPCESRWRARVREGVAADATRPARARLSPSRWSRPTPSTMSRPRSRTRRASLRTSSV